MSDHRISPQIDLIIDKLSLSEQKTHPEHFSRQVGPAASLDLITTGCKPRLRKAKSDLTIHFYSGNVALELFEFDLISGTFQRVKMSSNFMSGHSVQHLIKKGDIWTLLIDKNDNLDAFCLIGMTGGSLVSSAEQVDSDAVAKMFPSILADLGLVKSLETKKILVSENVSQEDELSLALKKVSIVEEERSKYEIRVKLSNEEQKELLAMMKSASETRTRSDTLVHIKNIPISLNEINLLLGTTQWLNDECINAYLSLLGEQYPRTFFFNTFFMTKLYLNRRYSYDGVRRWTRKTNIFEYDHIVVPVNHNNSHWSCAHINLKQRFIAHYDSMSIGQLSDSIAEILQRYILDEFEDKKKIFSIEFDMSSAYFTAPPLINVPQQQDGSSCGVFTCMFALYIAAEHIFDFSQRDIFNLRKQIAFRFLKLSEL